VSVLSTNAQATPELTVQRQQKDGSLKEVTYPEGIVVYKKYMGSMDKGYQLRILPSEAKVEENVYNTSRGFSSPL